MIPRRVSKQLKIGDVTIGGGAPIRVQSMTTAFTRDVEASVAEILGLAEAGLRDCTRGRAPQGRR